MQKEASLNHEAGVPSCSFCRPTSEQVRIILRGVYLRLKKLYKTKKFQSLEGQNSEQIHGLLGIQRLVRILFERHQFQLKLSQNCSHSFLQSLFRDKLRCRVDQLQRLLDQLSDRVARRNYQFEVISAQVKNVEQSVSKLQQGMEVGSEKKQSTLYSEEVREIREIEQAVKVEEEPKPIQFISPYTGTNSDDAFGSSSFQYNMLFYSHLYYQ